MEKGKDRIAETQDYILSGEFARAEKVEEEVEREEDTSYRVKGDMERSREVLSRFIAGKMFESGVGDGSD